MHNKRPKIRFFKWQRLAVGFFIALIALMLQFCKRNPVANRLHHNVPVTIHRLDVDLFNPKLTVEQLAHKYGYFFNIYTQHIISQTDTITPAQTTALIQQFTNDTIIMAVKHHVNEVYSNLQPYSKQFVNAFSRYHQHFPKATVPVIYTYIGGFNHSVVTSDSLIGIGLDKYLGAHYKYYQYLDIPSYKLARMAPNYLVCDALQAWLTATFPKSNRENSLLSHIIYQGKISYACSKLMPHTPDTVLMGYTKKQLAWCKANEAAMWLYLAEHKLLYSSQRIDIARYINDAPFTNGFPKGAPGRTGTFIGHQLVAAYVKKTHASLEQLFELDNAQQILMQSAYTP